MADKMIRRGEILSFRCLGCKSEHQVPITGEPKWEWNGSLSSPTIKPSLNVTWTYGEPEVTKRCHSVITDGKIAFCGDCTHTMAGQTVDLPDYEGR